MKIYSDQDAISFLINEYKDKFITQMKQYLPQTKNKRDQFINDLSEFLQLEFTDRNGQQITWRDYFTEKVSFILDKIFRKYHLSYSVLIKNGKISIDDMKLSTPSVLLIPDISLSNDDIIREFIVYPRSSFEFTYEVSFTTRPHIADHPFFDPQSDIDQGDGLVLELVLQLSPHLKGSWTDHAFQSKLNSVMQKLDHLVLVTNFDQLFTILIKQLQNYFSKK